MAEEETSLDVLGIKPIADAISTVTKASTDGVGALLARICLPAAEELGLLFKDKVHAWRGKNAAAIAAAAEACLALSDDKKNASVHPRIAGAIFDSGSWSDDDTVQKMWGGLLASACLKGGVDQSNLIFINFLNQLTPSEVKILEFSCTRTKFTLSSGGLVISESELVVDAQRALEISGLHELDRLDLELDHLRGLGLLGLTGGFSADRATPEQATVMPTADLTSTSLSLQFYVKCRGFTGTLREFLKLG